MGWLYGRLGYRLPGEPDIRTSVYPAHQNSDHRCRNGRPVSAFQQVTSRCGLPTSMLTVLPVITAEGRPLTFIAAQLVSARIFFNRGRRVGSLSVVLSALRCPTA